MEPSTQPESEYCPKCGGVLDHRTRGCPWCAGADKGEAHDPWAGVKSDDGLSAGDVARGFGGMLRDMMIRTPRMFIKCVFGNILIVVLTTCLPFFDDLPWNMPRYQKAATVRECLRNLSAHPAMTEDRFVFELQHNNKSDEMDAVFLKLYNMGPSAVPFLFREMKQKPETRAWGLLAMQMPHPPRIVSAKHAPPLNLLIQWMGDPDPVVAANARNVLNSYVRLPTDYLPKKEGSATDAAQTPDPAREHREWHARYKKWYEVEERVWNGYEGQFLSKHSEREARLPQQE